MCAVKVLVVSMLCGAKFIRRESARSSTMNACFSTSNGVFLTEKQIEYS